MDSCSETFAHLDRTSSNWNYHGQSTTFAQDYARSKKNVEAAPYSNTPRSSQRLGFCSSLRTQQKFDGSISTDVSALSCIDTAYCWSCCGNDLTEWNTPTSSDRGSHRSTGANLGPPGVPALAACRGSVVQRWLTTRRTRAAKFHARAIATASSACSLVEHVGSRTCLVLSQATWATATTWATFRGPIA